MINQLYIENFKSHLRTDISLSHLNLLTGSNGVGKSSIIQVLLLLRQSYQERLLNKGIKLNKPLCDIGTIQDALNTSAEAPCIKFKLSIDEETFEWKSKPIEERDFLSTFLELEQFEQSSYILNQINTGLFNENFQYISAARFAPKEYYNRDDYRVPYGRQISVEKGQAELIAHFLDYFSQEDIYFTNLHHPNQAEKTLISQTTAWEKEISNNVNIIINRVGKNFEIKYNFDTDDGLTTSEFKAENVGFGLTYALPIIVAILSAKPNSLILIENPEAHLHPYAQSKLAELMALAAMNNIQLIVETHSDHIINGVLVSIKNFEKTQKGVSHDRVKIFYVERDESQHTANVINVPVLSGGRLGKQPKGFFDQIDKDLEKLMGF